MTPMDLAFMHAPTGLALTENRIVQQCNLRFAEMFGAKVDAFNDMPLERLYPSLKDYQKVERVGGDRLRKTSASCGDWMAIYSGVAYVAPA